MIEFFIPIALAFLTIFAKALDYEGAFAAAAFSYMILFRHNIYWLLVLFVFFSVCTVATIFKLERKKKHTARLRGASNVIANGIVAIFMALIGQFYGFVGAIAAACGDTLSSEIGMLSKQKPIMITTLKETKTGINGGITLLGTVAAAVGGAIIGLAAWPIAPYFHTIWTCAVCGLLGSLFDSYLGAAFENDSFMGNFGVNLMATLFGALIAIFIFVVW